MRRASEREHPQLRCRVEELMAAAASSSGNSVCCRPVDAARYASVNAATSAAVPNSPAWPATPFIR